MSVFRRLRIFDYLIFAFIVILALWAAFFLYAGEGGEARLIIETPHGKWIYPLTDTRTVSIPGAIGATTVRIENQSARIIDSPCPHKTCIKNAVLKKAGDWNACLPNRVFLRIESTSSEYLIPP